MRSHCYWLTKQLKGPQLVASCYGIWDLSSRSVGRQTGPSVTLLYLSNLFLQRYEYYISRGVPDHSLAAQDQDVMERILQRRIPDKLTRNTELDPLITSLKQEVVGDYDFSVRKSIGELKGHCDICYLQIVLQDCNKWQPLNNLSNF